VELREAHFERWLRLWSTTVDDGFAGERADQAKAHAVRVAHAFHGRLQGFATPANGASAPLLAVTRHGS
jgi:hemoglobin